MLEAKSTRLNNMIVQALLNGHSVRLLKHRERRKYGIGYGSGFGNGCGDGFGKYGITEDQATYIVEGDGNQ